MGLFGSRKKSGFEKALDTVVQHQVKAQKQRDAVEEVQQEIRQMKMASSPKRKTYGVVTKSKSFPLGVKGLTPLETIYTGASTMCWLFENEESKLLVSSEVEKVNNILQEAGTFVAMDFDTITSFSFDADLREDDEILNAGEVVSMWGFTRAEYSPITKTGNDNPNPMKLKFETHPISCSSNSHSGTISYSPDGSIKKVEVTRWVTNMEAYKITASSSKAGLIVKKVEKLSDGGNEGSVLYKG